MDDTARASKPGWRTFLVEHYWPGVTAAKFGAGTKHRVPGIDT